MCCDSDWARVGFDALCVKVPGGVKGCPSVLLLEIAEWAFCEALVEVAGEVKTGLVGWLFAVLIVVGAGCLLGCVVGVMGVECVIGICVLFFGSVVVG